MNFNIGHIMLMFLHITCVLHVVIGQSHYGREFYMGMINNFIIDSKEITIDIASTSPGQLYLYVPIFGINRTQTFSQGATHISLNSSITQIGSYTAHRGIYLQTSVDVAVYVTNFKGDTTDTYLALPVESLGKKYTVASYKPYIKWEMAEFMVIGVYEFTQVNVTFTNGSKVQKSINRLDVYQEASSNEITGSLIETDRPVAVISGAMCSFIRKRGCDMTLSQMFPNEALNTTYILPPLYPSSNDSLLRILTVGQDNNTVCFYANDSTTCNQTSPYQIHDFYFGLEPVVVTGAKPFAAFDFAVDDPFMLTVPSIYQNLYDYSFVVPTVYTNHFTNYLAVTIHTDATDGLLLDGHTPTELVNSFKVPHPLSYFSVLIYNISTGYHRLQHIDNVPFGAFCYGNEQWAKYGFPVGINFGEPRLTEIHGGQMCFNCEDLSHTGLCDTVKQCAENQTCFVERYTLHGRTTYTSGCTDFQTCRSSRSTPDVTDDGVCTECCQSDFCNYKGCGDKGLPPRDNRGPLCFDCQHVATPDECFAIQLCPSNMVCGIEEIQWGDQSSFKLGCAEAMCGPLHQHDEPRATRAAPLCRSCCAEDFCNQNCTRSGPASHIPIIIG